MSWRMTGTYYAPCSCKVSCPCELGEMEGDQGWCSGALAFEVRSGNVDGTDISGVRVVLVGDWPRGFLGGDGTGRLYWDAGVSQEQRSAFEPVLQGRQGGVWEPLGSLISRWLDSRQTAISVRKDGDATRISVEGFGELVSEPLKGATGEFTRLLHGAAAFRDDIVLARGSGSSWRDPEMRQWQSGGHSEQADFDWSA